MATPGRRYTIFGQRACASAAPQTIVGVTSGGSNLKRPGIYQILFGSTATPADNALLFEGQRSTAAGTGTTSTAPTALDPADTAADCTSNQNHSADPTFTANTILLYLPLNQRASHRWDSDPLGALVGAATANNGIGIWATHASFTGNISAHLYYWE